MQTFLHPHGRRDGWRVKGLRWWIMSALSEGPKNGAEISSWIEGRSEGFWRPSPGSLYPMLAQLCEEGIIKKCEDGRYRLVVGLGPSFWRVASGPVSVDVAMNEVESYIAYIEDLAKIEPDKVKGYSEKIKGMAERLQKLAGTQRYF
ncbi:PadR family transcriptional regulator [Tardisphaera miroshnichenkoae]